MNKSKIPSLFATPKERRLDAASLRAKTTADPKGFAQQVQDLVDEGDLSFRSLARGLGLRGLYSALKEIPITVAVPDHIDGGQRLVTTGALNVALAGLGLGMMREVIEGFTPVADQLVEDVESTKPALTIPAVLLASGENDLRHQEGMPYLEVGPSDERYDIGDRPQGVRMKFTEEMVRRDEVAMAQRLTQKFTQIPLEDRELHTFKMVTDHTGSAASGAEPYVLHRNKSGAALYSTTAIDSTRVPSGTRIQNNGLTDYTSLEAARARLAGFRNERGKPIANPVSSMILLVPDAKASVASRILNSVSVPGNVNEMNDWGPQGRHRPTLVSSPYLDTLSTSAWYLGAFRRQFVRKISQQLRFLSISGENFHEFVRSGVLMEMSYSWDMEVGAVGFEHVVQCLSGTTAPADE